MIGTIAISRGLYARILSVCHYGADGPVLGVGWVMPTPRDSDNDLTVYQRAQMLFIRALRKRTHRDVRGNVNAFEFLSLLTLLSRRGQQRLWHDTLNDETPRLVGPLNMVHGHRQHDKSLPSENIPRCHRPEPFVMSTFFQSHEHVGRRGLNGATARRVLSPRGSGLALARRWGCFIRGTDIMLVSMRLRTRKCCLSSCKELLRSLVGRADRCNRPAPAIALPVLVSCAGLRVTSYSTYTPGRRPLGSSIVEQS